MTRSSTSIPRNRSPTGTSGRACGWISVLHPVYGGAIAYGFLRRGPHPNPPHKREGTLPRAILLASKPRGFAESAPTKSPSP
ncbi:hypothetical protein EOA13_36080, partial [Mesorhizobium sp. M7A.F.Ca.US.011.01.1.1]